MKRCFAVAIPSIVLSLVLLLVSSCSYVTPEAENELRGFEDSSTDYYVRDGVLSIKKRVFGYRMVQEENRVDDTKNKEMTYLCGWAPVTQSGDWKGLGGLSATPYKSRHCNMQFRISKDGTNLEGRQVDLNYPNSYEQWPLLFTIPISNHYFYEKDVDSRGRELNKYKKVTDRKNWQLAPAMDLDLKKIHWHDRQRRPGSWFWGGRITDVFDIEISKEDDKQFIAFNGTHVHGLWGSNVQHVYRFNFLEIKENPGFQRTYYDTNNSQYMNILHILGYQPDGSRANEVKYAAHWDVRQPVEFCLNGFPEDTRKYKQIGIDVIEEMNVAMYSVHSGVPVDKIKNDPEAKAAYLKAQRYFSVSDKKMKYDYDLRCPSITWIDDPALSFRAPLGIGLVNTNIKTGEILWGGAVIWGGLIDYIVNRDSESVSDAMARNTFRMIGKRNSIKGNPYFQDISSHLDISQYSRRFTALEDVIKSKMGETDSEAHASETLARMQDQLKALNEENDTDLKNEMEATLLEDIKNALAMGDLDTSDFKNFKTGEAYNKLYRFQPLNLESDSDILIDFDSSHSNEERFLNDISRFTGMAQNVNYSSEETERKNLVENPNMTHTQALALVNEFMEDQANQAIDAENTVDHVYDSVTSAISKLSGLERLAAAKTFIKNVTLHELGHVVGLGHQFAGNKVPERGTVPESLYSKIMHKEVPEGHYYSSIMDYMSGHTEVSLPYEKVQVQIQDQLTLAYLYKQEYATYNAGDENFVMVKMQGTNGVIPSTTPVDGVTRYTRYMPQCSDIDAYLSTDPYCRRWDKGYDAPSMVSENEKEYTDNFLSRLNSFTDATGRNPWWAQFRLWDSTYNLMNYNRTFYDRLRYKLMTNEVYRSVFDKIKKDEAALYAFSAACVDPTRAPVPKTQFKEGEIKVTTDNGKWPMEFTKLALQPSRAMGGYNRVVDMHDNMTDSDYQDLYNIYKSVLGTRNTSEMTDEEFSELENELHEQGVAFSEVQKLCRASSKSLKTTKLLLSLKGPDHIMLKSDSEIVPTGLRGGEATSDYSRVWGTYSQLGLLPIKLAALDVLTNTSSTMGRYWWRYRKPKYNNPNDGKYGYHSLYPIEFTDLVGTSVRNNMGFGGTEIQDAATMSVANLYTNYYLFRTFFWSNDNQARGFKTDYMKDLKAQTRFQLQLAPVLLETIERKPRPEKFGFRPKLFNFAERKIIDLDSAYALPDREVIISGNDSEIIMPITKMRYLSQGAFYVWAIHVTYDKTSYDDPLIAYSIKTAINELTVQELEKCIGGSTGLSSFFDSEEFKGFDIQPGIAKDPDAQRIFEDSLKEAFAAYHSREGLTPLQIGCEQSKNGIGLITSTALSLNGYFLPAIFDFIQK